MIGGGVFCVHVNRRDVRRILNGPIKRGVGWGRGAIGTTREEENGKKVLHARGHPIGKPPLGFIEGLKGTDHVVVGETFNGLRYLQFNVLADDLARVELLLGFLFRSDVRDCSSN